MKQKLSDFKWIIKLLWEVCKPEVLLMLIVRLINVLAPVIVTFVSGLLINKLVKLEDFQSKDLIPEFGPYLLALLFLIILEDFTSALDYFSEIKFNYKWNRLGWAKYIHKIVTTDIEAHESKEFNLMHQKAGTVIFWRAVTIARQSTRLLAALIGLILVGGLLLTINPIFILLLFIPISFDFIVSKKYGQALYNIWDTDGDEKIHSNKAMKAFDDLDSIKEARVYGFADKIISVFLNAQLSFVNSANKPLNRKFFYMFISTIISSLIFVGFNMFLISEILDGQLEIGSYTFLLANIFVVSNRLSQVEGSISSLIEQMNYVSDLRKIFDLKSKIIISKNPQKVEKSSPKIEFRNVSFKYPNTKRYIFKNLSFKIDSGEKIALIGKNGAGKTTLIKLLARFYDVNEGEILINNINIKELDLDSYYKLWGVLFQSFAKF
ncbi:MAG: ABC transporter ATP-binding protein [Candidatus Dojkabacteria bacterium]|nr:ABC transporter ATP-binding protein [Candidatus Dojkabacteria bacterium]